MKTLKYIDLLETHELNPFDDAENAELERRLALLPPSPPVRRGAIITYHRLTGLQEITT